MKSNSMVYLMFFLLMIVLTSCGTAENSSLRQSFTESSNTVSKSSSVKEQENLPSAAEDESFDYNLTQEQYLFYTSDAPEALFLIKQGDNFKGWNAQQMSYVGSNEDFAVNLRAVFIGDIRLKGEIVIYQDAMSGAESAYFLPKEDSIKKIPRFYLRGIEQEEPAIFIVEGIKNKDIPEGQNNGLSVVEIKETMGEPLIREKNIGNGEFFTETYYPSCTIGAQALMISYGEDIEGHNAMGYIYQLTIDTIEWE